MDREIDAAATWWADQLRQIPTPHAGEARANTLSSLYAQALTRPTEAQIARFREALVAQLHELLSPPVPTVMRVSVAHYGPDDTLESALQAAGIARRAWGLLCPMRTCMWLTPGRVTVARGERAASVTVYEEQPNSGGHDVGEASV